MPCCDSEYVGIHRFSRPSKENNKIMPAAGIKLITIWFRRTRQSFKLLWIILHHLPEQYPGVKQV